MTSLVILGGRQRTVGLRMREEWRFFDEARVIGLDTATGETSVRMRHETPRELCPEIEPSFVFKAGSWDGSHLLLCTQTEVLTVDPAKMEIVERWSHPWLNDVHHVARLRGRLHVVSTGLDSLLVVDPRSGDVTLRPALDEDPWQRFDPKTDYRRVPTTKPHLSHPNFVFETRHGVWLTRLLQKDAVCLDDPGRRIDIGVGYPHDGHLFDDRVWFTTVNGHLVAADPESGRTVEHYDLNEIEGRGEPLGWCRGLHLEGDVAYVGLSRVRATRWRQHLSWIRPGDLPSSPTRIVAYDLRRRLRLAEWEVESAGMSGIFSVLPAEPR